LSRSMNVMGLCPGRCANAAAIVRAASKATNMAVIRPIEFRFCRLLLWWDRRSFAVD
jgi:hypothetical protein